MKLPRDLSGAALVRHLSAGITITVRSTKKAAT